MCIASVSSRECQAGPGVARSIGAEQRPSATVGELAEGLRSLCRLGRPRGPDSSVHGGFSEFWSEKGQQWENWQHLHRIWSSVHSIVSMGILWF